MKTITLRKELITAIVIVSMASLFALMLKPASANGPSKSDYQNLQDIIDNQEILEENREAHEKFMQAKQWNEAEVRALNDAGWNVDWHTMQLVPLTKPVTLEVDLDKLSKAVAVAETSGCTDGTARSRNNCHGIMCWPKTGRTPCYFPSHAASHAAFKKLWAKPTMPYKGQLPDIRLAKIYSGNDHPDTWLCNVHRSYFDIQIPDCHAYLQKTFGQQYAVHFGSI